MSLTATQPDREVIDGLMLDAAWERAKQCETELLSVRAMAKTNYENFDRELKRRLNLDIGIRNLISNLRGSPDRSIGSIVDDLSDLLHDDE